MFNEWTMMGKASKRIYPFLMSTNSYLDAQSLSQPQVSTQIGNKFDETWNGKHALLFGFETDLGTLMSNSYTI